MSAFRTSAAGLLRLATEGTLADRVAEQVWMSGHGVSPAERRSWSRSLAVLGQDLADAGLDQVEVLVEYQLPLTSKRVDVVLAGVNPTTGGDSYVVVELKQWSYATSYEGSDTLVAVEHTAGPRLHPGVQVADYCEYLTDFLGVLNNRRNLVKGVAYLHNAVDRDVNDLFERPPTEQSRLFTKQRRGQFLEYLQTHLAAKPGAPSADRFLTSSVQPSRHLLTYAAKELKERSYFTLIDEQHLAFELVLHAVERARSADRKSVVVVAGGPGSGKSVIALSVLGELARQQRSVMHATGSRSFTQTLRRYAGRGSTRLQNLFKYFNSFMTAERNGFDVLICDEAHRIRETSVNRYTPKAKRETARPQIDELIAAARVPVFLLDEHQVVKPGELGSVDVISGYARQLGLDVEVVSLHDQFRCGGSDEYEWSGVIIGPDLVARNGRLVTQRSESKDPAFKSKKALSDEEADRLIRNTYKVLMTRGMRGTMLYSTDSETRDYLAKHVRVRRGLETVYESVAPGVYERGVQAGDITRAAATSRSPL